MRKRILDSNANYEEVVRDNGYFVDKTAPNLNMRQIFLEYFKRTAPDCTGLTFRQNMRR